MRDEVPAAPSLILFAAGLAAAPLLVNPGTTIVLTGLCAVLLWRHVSRRGAAAVFCAALGFLTGVRHEEERGAEVESIRALHPDVFARVEGPIDRDWMPRGTSRVLALSRFTVNGMEIEQPLRIYARFDPPPIGMSQRVWAEGFIRRSRHGHFTLSLKSPRLLGYSGELSIFDPQRWNRAATYRVRRYAARYPEEVALIEALALGRGESLSAEAREGFRRGGTYHLLVFSGLQIAFAATVIAALLRFLGAPRASDWSLLLFAAIAPLFIGPTPSVSRASLGIALYALSRIARRPTSLSNLWCVSAMLRLIAVPGDLTDVAFQLTYAGAGSLIFLGRPLAGTRLKWLGYALAAEVAITPITLFHFHQYALGGSLLTIAMTPLIFAMLVLSSAFCVSLAEPLLLAIGVLNRLCGVMNNASALFSGFAPAPPLESMCWGFSLAVLAMGFARGKRRTAGIIAALLIPSLATVAMAIRLREVPHPRLTVLDVGQGEAILVRTSSRTMLVDAGGRQDDPHFGESTLLPLLVDRGVFRIDTAVLTHVHPDHCGGLPSVLAHLDVGEVWISPRHFRGACAHQILEEAGERLVPIRLIREPYRDERGGLDVRAWPSPRRFRKNPENNSSLVLHVAAGGRKILLTGDIEREREAGLLDEDLRADVLKVAHHGSRTSSTPLFLDAVRPRLAVISCGRRNLFRHPHPAVVEALRTRGVRVLRTDLDGTLDFEFRRGAILVRREIDTPIGEP